MTTVDHLKFDNETWWPNNSRPLVGKSVKLPSKSIPMYELDDKTTSDDDPRPTWKKVSEFLPDKFSQSIIGHIKSGEDDYVYCGEVNDLNNNEVPVWRKLSDILANGGGIS